MSAFACALWLALVGTVASPAWAESPAPAPAPDPAVDPASRADILRILELSTPSAAPLDDALRERLVQAYARRFAPSELRALRAFYETPAGARLAAEWPAMLREARQDEPSGRVLAEVDGSPITEAELRAAATRKSPESGTTLSPAQLRELLDDLIESRLLAHEARRLGLDQDAKVEMVMVNTLLRQEVYGQVRNDDFDDATLRRYFEAHADEFRVPEKRQVLHLLVKVGPERPDATARAEIEALHRQLVARPDDFRDVATRASDDPYRRRGGDVGFVSREGKPGLEPEILDQAFALEVGAVSPVFKTASGYHVIRVAARREAVERTFEQMKGSTLRKVKADRLADLYAAYVARLRRGTHIVEHAGQLDGLEVKGASPGTSPGVQPGVIGALDDTEDTQSFDRDDLEALPPVGRPPPGEADAPEADAPEAVAEPDSAGPLILGSLDRSLIDAVVRHNLPAVRECYTPSGAPAQRRAGTVTVKFVVAKDGTVSSAVTRSSTLGSAGTERCLNEAFLGFRFPEPKAGGIVIVSYPIRFSAAD